MLRWPTGQRQATLCLMLSPLTSPSGSAGSDPSAQPASQALQKFQIFPFLPPGQSPRCINLPAGGWLGAGPYEQGTGYKCEMMILGPRAKGRWAHLETEMPPVPGSLPS